MLRSIRLARIAYEAGVSGYLENPEPMGDHVSVFDFEGVKAFMKLPGVHVIDFDQCVHGSETPKPTRLIYWGMDLSKLAGRCDHPNQEWEYVDPNGRVRKRLSPHPPLAGRRREDGHLATKMAAAYPSKMNRIIAEAIARIPTNQQGCEKDRARSVLGRGRKIRFEKRIYSKEML